MPIDKSKIVEEEFADQLRHGDEAAMKEVFRLYSSRLYFFALKIIGSRDDVEDIIQEGFLNFWLQIRESKIVPDNLQAYLFQTIRNLCISYLRRQRMKDESNDTIIEQFQHEIYDYIKETTLQEELFHRIYQHFDALTPIQAQIMKLLYSDGLSVQEVARELDTTDNNVRNHKARALERLKRIVDKEVFLLFVVFFEIY